MNGITEDTVSNLLAGYLRSRELNVLTQITVDFPSKWGKPDFQVKDDGLFFGEAEWEGNESQGLVEAYNYLQAPNAMGTFLVVYSKKLKKDLSKLD